MHPLFLSIVIKYAFRPYHSNLACITQSHSLSLPILKRFAMKRYTLLHLIAIAVLLIVSMNSAASVSDLNNKIPSRITMSKEVLLDKIKGAWAGQVIGCTYSLVALENEPVAVTEAIFAMVSGRLTFREPTVMVVELSSTSGLPALL